MLGVPQHHGEGQRARQRAAGLSCQLQPGSIGGDQQEPQQDAGAEKQAGVLRTAGPGRRRRLPCQPRPAGAGGRCNRQRPRRQAPEQNGRVSGVTITPPTGQQRHGESAISDGALRNARPNQRLVVRHRIKGPGTAANHGPDARQQGVVAGDPTAGGDRACRPWADDQVAHRRSQGPQPVGPSSVRPVVPATTRRTSTNSTMTASRTGGGQPVSARDRRNIQRGFAGRPDAIARRGALSGVGPTRPSPADVAGCACQNNDKALRGRAGQQQSAAKSQSRGVGKTGARHPAEGGGRCGSTTSA